MDTVAILVLLHNNNRRWIGIISFTPDEIARNSRFERKLQAFSYVEEPELV